MNPKIKQLWLDALRSGTYQQGQKALRSKSGFCCLGVLCDLYDKTQEWTLWQETTTDTTYDGEHSYLPESVVAWAELDSMNPAAEGIPLASYNDGAGGAIREHSFVEIADLIERNL